MVDYSVGSAWRVIALSSDRTNTQMPRLNYGTLLENIVVLESARICLDGLTVESPLGFASAFAMPPLTQCWCKPGEEVSNPEFNHVFLQRVAKQDNPSQSLQQFWSLSIRNRPNLPVHPFDLQYPDHSYESAGPNGALLAAMLGAQRNRAIHLWINDNAERYGTVRQAAGVEPDTLTGAGLLVGLQATGSTSDVIGLFPSTIARLTDWLAKGSGRGTTVRVGFLDPDNYAEGQTQVSPADHQHWLRVLAKDSTHVLSATFSGCQNRGPGNLARNQRLASFHKDEVALYPLSIVFEYGNFQTGVKVRWPDGSIRQVVAELRRCVEAAWCGWSPS